MTLRTWVTASASALAWWQAGASWWFTRTARKKKQTTATIINSSALINKVTASVKKANRCTQKKCRLKPAVRPSPQATTLSKKTSSGLTHALAEDAAALSRGTEHARGQRLAQTGSGRFYPLLRHACRHKGHSPHWIHLIRRNNTRQQLRFSFQSNHWGCVGQACFLRRVTQAFAALSRHFRCSGAYKNWPLPAGCRWPCAGF